MRLQSDPFRQNGIVHDAAQHRAHHRTDLRFQNGLHKIPFIRRNGGHIHFDAIDVMDFPVDAVNVRPRRFFVDFQRQDRFRFGNVLFDDFRFIVAGGKVGNDIGRR